MLSKFKLYKPISRLVNPKFAIFSLKNDIHIVNASDSLSINEPPELPRWVKFSEHENPLVADPQQDDDYVFPAIADWVENQKHHSISTNAVKSNLIEFDTTIDKEVERICQILKTRFSSPNQASKALSNYCGNVDLSEDLVQKMLKRFSHDWIPAFGVFKWALKQSGYNYSPNLYDFMVDLLGKAKKFNIMWELVEEMLKFDGYVTLSTMSKVIRRFSKTSMWNDAIEAFRRVEDFGVKKDIDALNILIDALAKENHVEDAYKVFMEFKNEIPPNIITFNILIQGWCKVRKLDDALNALKEMEKHGFKPNVVTYTSFIEAYCRDKDYRKVFDTLDEMHLKGCPPNIVTYTIVIHSLGKSKEIRQALLIFKKMKENGCVPNVACYSSLIYILSLAGRFSDAQDLFEDMIKDGITPDILTYNTIISVACRNSQEDTALKFLRRMEEASCKPNLKTYAPLLKMCGYKKRMKVLYFLLNHMFKNDVSLDVGTYSLLVHVLCKSGKPEHACLFFEEMVLKELVPKEWIYKLLMEKLEEKSMGKAKVQIENLIVKIKSKIQL